VDVLREYLFSNFFIRKYSWFGFISIIFKNPIRSRMNETINLIVKYINIDITVGAESNEKREICQIVAHVAETGNCTI